LRVAVRFVSTITVLARHVLLERYIIFILQVVVVVVVLVVSS